MMNFEDEYMNQMMKAAGPPSLGPIWRYMYPSRQFIGPNRLVSRSTGLTMGVLQTPDYDSAMQELANRVDDDECVTGMIWLWLHAVITEKDIETWHKHYGEKDAEE